MALNIANLLGMPPIVTRQLLTARDTIIYALGVGASDLRFVYEHRLEALPTLPVVLGHPGFFWRQPEFGVDWRRILHGAQSLTVHRPIPVEGEIVGTTRIVALYDRGKVKGTIAAVRREVHGAEGSHLATSTSFSLLRGDGGCGSSGPSAEPPAPTPVPEGLRPDYTLTLRTQENQALLYRLSGDLNPLHIDPEAAKAAGFERPILHGLATYGIIGRGLMECLGNSQPSLLRRLDVRFTSPLFPGESIALDVWRLNPAVYAFRARCAERGTTVVNNGYVELG